MPKKAQITDYIFARGVSHLAADINSIRERHKIEPADLVRGLLEAAAKFYRDQGFFSFPVRIEPEDFQRSYIARGASFSGATLPGKGAGSLAAGKAAPETGMEMGLRYEQSRKSRKIPAKKAGENSKA
jgi:hypothetical protein